MDKPKGNTITIKLNGQDQKFIDEPKGSQLEESSDSFHDVIEMESAHMEEDALLEAAAAEESPEESFDWIIPETSENDIKEYKIVHHSEAKNGSSKKLISFSKSAPKGRNIGSVLFAAIFAIVLGIAFGFMMLKLVIADHGQKAATLTNGTVANGASSVNGTVASGTTSTVVNALNTFVIQQGIYSSKTAAKEAAQNASSNGLPAKMITMNGKEYLFLGVADSQDNAKKLGSLYKQKGIDVFSKPLATQGKKVTNLNQTEKTFLDAAADIYQSLAQITATGILSNSASAGSISGFDKLLKPDGINSTTIKNLQTELAAAEAKVKSYQKSKNQANLSDAQQHLLNFLAVYYSM